MISYSVEDLIGPIKRQINDGSFGEICMSSSRGCREEPRRSQSWSGNSPLTRGLGLPGMWEKDNNFISFIFFYCLKLTDFCLSLLDKNNLSDKRGIGLCS